VKVPKVIVDLVRQSDARDLRTNGPVDLEREPAYPGNVLYPRPRGEFRVA